MLDTPEFLNPPIVELVFGAQFAPLTKLTTGHFGLFWDYLGREDWPKLSDAPPLEDQFELFDGPRWGHVRGLEFRLQQLRPTGRFMLEHRDGNRLIQIQPSRFHLNWRKPDDRYPSYRRLISDFENLFAKFASFVDTHGLGKVQINQWELTYVDAFPQGEYWQTPANWSSFLPGLFGTLRAADGLILESRAAEWHYEIPPRRGRLHIVAKPGSVSAGEKTSLLLDMTARGPVGGNGVESLRAGLDIGHDSAVGTFLRVTSPDARARWGEKK